MTQARVRQNVVRAGWLMLLLAAAGVHASAQTGTAGYWHTSGRQILDADESPLRIAGVNWFGMETSTFAPHGLWVRNYKEMLNQIRSLGFNAVRLPFSNQLFDPESRPNSIDFDLNPDLRDLSGLEIMDRIVAHAGRIGLRIILDRHRPDAIAQSQLWYTANYPESRWIEDWKMLAARYKGDTTVVAVDLHNEPRTPACWGCGELSLDWRLAAQRAGNEILSVNPNLLIIVQGVEMYENETYWWGGNLRGVADAPVLLSVANRIVYSAHDYPASISAQAWFHSPDYPANLPGVWDKFWGYIAATDVAPVLMGEFGSRLDTETDRKWFESITEYLGAKEIHWMFWSWNPNSQDTGGLLMPDWTGVDDQRLSRLRTIQPLKPGSGAADPAETPPTDPGSAAPPDAPAPDTPADEPEEVTFCTAIIRSSNDWGTAYTADLHVTNTGAGSVEGWTITWEFSGTQKIRDLWNGGWTQQDKRIIVRDAGWNAKLPEKSAVNLGFVAEYTDNSGSVSNVTLNGFPCISKGSN